MSGPKLKVRSNVLRHGTDNPVVRRMSLHFFDLLAALLLGACQPGADLGDEPGRVVVTLDDVHVVPTPDVLARIVDGNRQET